MRVVGFVLFALVWQKAALAQSVHFGGKVGIPITEYFQTGSASSRTSSVEYTAATRRYTFGAAVEWRVGSAAGFEVDAMYHRMGYVVISQATESSGFAYRSAIDVKGNSWDFPVMVKYRFGKMRRPFAGGGGVIRFVGPVRGRGEMVVQNLATGATTRTPIDTGNPAELAKRVYPGLTALGGFEFKWRILRVAPELRYTRWTSNISGEGGLLRFAPNQVEFLVGVLF
jgi:hypothetical protein